MHVVQSAVSLLLSFRVVCPYVRQSVRRIFRVFIISTSERRQSGLDAAADREAGH